MTLAAGTRIGPYEILAPLGQGGMGEVYRARDSKLDRDVAIKLLPELFAHDPDRLARFEREAKTLASLNHPNIAAIYGLEESAGVRALVLELVEGPTLADRIAQAPAARASSESSSSAARASGGGAPRAVKEAGLPLDEALPIARQIADALEAAHEQGIIHHDLKPANVKVKADGAVKVLDFGLAKALQDVGRGLLDPPGSPDLQGLSPDLKGPAYVQTNSPTLTFAATQAGMILGTAAYMAPEQARGKAVDKRADIWAFGCVLYEMLAGRRAFGTDEVSDTLAMVLMKEPDWPALPAATPPTVRTLLRRCLEKDPKRRLPAIGAARLEIDKALSSPAPQMAVGENASQRGRQYLAWVAAGLAGVAALGVSALYFTERPPEPTPSIRFQVSPPADPLFLPGTGTSLALSPDGRQVVFQIAPRGEGPSTGKLAVRAFDADQARELPGTEGATSVFWSPDSRFIGFFAEGRLKKMDVTGGPPLVLCDVPSLASTGGSAGGSWNDDGTIVFALQRGGLFRVSSGGGTSMPVTTLDPAKKEISHRHPWFLPDGRRFLHVVATSDAATFATSVHVASLDDASRVPVFPSDSKAIYADGFLLFIRQGTLLAQPFDAARLVTTGDPVVVAEDVAFNQGSAGALFSVSTTGVLSYRRSSSGGFTQLVWLNRGGKLLGTIGEKADQTTLALSPDGGRAAISVLDPVRRTRDIWIQDLIRGLRTRLTFNAGDDWSSTWSPDSRPCI